MKRTAAAWDTTALPDGHLENHARLYLTLKKLMPRQGSTVRPSSAGPRWATCT